jgi:hypothetical protein
VRTKPREPNSFANAETGERIRSLRPSSSMNSTKFPAQATARNLIQQHAREFGAVANVEGEGLSRRVDPRLLPQLMLDQREGGDEPRAGVGLR